MTVISQQWTLTQKIIFRYVFISFGLFIILQNNGAYPLLGMVSRYIDQGLHLFIPWMAKNFIHPGYEITVFTNGSGDTTYDYLILLVIALAAIPGTLIWSLTDRKRLNYYNLYYWLTVAARYYVGFMLIQYGSIKVIKLQFSSPTQYRLNEAYGDSTPMGLAWTFLGFSTGYNLFMGIAELMAGFLLFRRTVAIGAIFTLMASVNVMAVNYFYNVPVKIISTGLVTLSIFLLSPNLDRLYQLFIRGEAIKLQTIDPPYIKKKWLRYTKIAFKYLLISFVIVVNIIQLLQGRKQYGDAAPKSPLYGTYTVEMYKLNKDTIPPDTRQQKRWKALFIGGVSRASIRLMNDSLQTIDMSADTKLKKLTLIFDADSTKAKQILYYEIPGKGRLLIKGKLYGDSIKVELSKKSFRLMDTNFHWINERPDNK
ncbi:hypothetical protein [Pedobacter sp. L105]|uniref:hypothetical protein n=1 Tax=Pedobacter sp. L105 TaxID=1641871 RepID=UPI00131C2A1D|nr:hypothetical protein [Pedobacter sp. L105]